MDEWQYDKADDLEQNWIERLRNFPRQPDMMVYGLRLTAMAAIRLWLRVYHRLRITGLEHLPLEGSFVLIANHTSHLDTLSLLSALPLRQLHRVFPAAAQDYFFTNLPRLALAAVVVNALPFSRRGQVQHSLALCRHLLERPGCVLVIFPEGTRSATGELGPFKAGIGLLLAGKDVPVIPCHLAGAHQAWPKGRWWPRPGRLRLTIGPPRRYQHLKCGKDAALTIAEELRQAVEELGRGPEASVAPKH